MNSRYQLSEKKNLKAHWLNIKCMNRFHLSVMGKYGTLKNIAQSSINKAQNDRITFIPLNLRQ